MLGVLIKGGVLIEGFHCIGKLCQGFQIGQFGKLVKDHQNLLISVLTYGATSIQIDKFNTN
jgi:hypothetical protein